MQSVQVQVRFSLQTLAQFLTLSVVSGVCVDVSLYKGRASLEMDIKSIGGACPIDGRVSRFAEPTLAKLGEITESISLWPRLAPPRPCNADGDS